MSYRNWILIAGSRLTPGKFKIKSRHNFLHPYYRHKLSAPLAEILIWIKDEMLGK
jgi:hypothetical protein